MNVQALVRAMPGLDKSKAEAVLPHLHAAMARGEITTLRRAQYFLAQLGHESMSLRHFEEIASGAAYEGRHDLGNTQPGDGRRFKGRGPIQLTGRTNYEKFGKWLGKGDLFVRKPQLVSRYDYGFLAAVFYWSTPHGPRQARLNVYCDAGDFEGLTRAINGGLNGFPDRKQRLSAIQQLGEAVLPSPVDPYEVLTRTERSAVRRLQALRARANRPPEKGGGWGSASDPTSRKSRAARTKALIKGFIRRIELKAAAAGWDKGHRRERHEVLKLVLGDATPAASGSGVGAAPPFPGEMLTLGRSGEAVRTWQAQMSKRGYAIEVDGEYGLASEQACRDLQEEKELEVDGVVGPQTWEATWAVPAAETGPRSEESVAAGVPS